MADPEKTFLFRMTNVANIPHVLQHGITHASSANSNQNFVPIGDASLISTRTLFTMPNGYKLGDYIPFYFGPRMPMLYVIQRGFNSVKATPAKDVVYCITTVQAIVNTGIDFVFTDGHAIDNFTAFFGPPDIDQLDSIVDFNAVKEKYWNKENDLDLKRRKEAEFLVAGDIPVEAVVGFAVFNEACAESVRQMQNFGNKKVVVKPNYYF